jgi:hypothetical protein
VNRRENEKSHPPTINLKITIIEKNSKEIRIMRDFLKCFTIKRKTSTHESAAAIEEGAQETETPKRIIIIKIYSGHL